jgi:Oligosaccharyltransferase 48 kDa subunit beta
MGLFNPHRSQMTTSIILAVCLLASCIAPASATKEKVLVLLDSLEMQETHSKFLQNINPKAFDVTIGTMDTKSINLKEWDSWLYDKLVILGGATSKTAVFSSLAYLAGCSLFVITRACT